MDPISPKNAKKVVPQVLIVAVNELINENLRIVGKVTMAMVLQKDIIARTVSKMDHSDFDMKWLDFEPYYQDVGWTVTYSKPDYTENFDAYFTFKAKEE